VTESPGARRRSLADKLDHLFRTIHPASHGEYSFEEVAGAIRARGGPTISATYVWQLRRGVRDNPTKKHLEALAQFFGVPPAYFFDDEAAARIDAELALLVALRDGSVRRIALRAAGLSAESLGTITEMVERVRQLEGLPDRGAGAGPAPTGDDPEPGAAPGTGPT
jgi:transcriptional regulator with XRE-family HTH domain